MNSDFCKPGTPLAVRKPTSRAPRVLAVQQCPCAVRVSGTLIGMQLWIDADACPVMIREVLFKAAMRRRMHLTLVANQSMQTPRSPYLHSIRVAPGFDVADNEIVQRCEANDLVITSDIPLAAEVVAKGAHALSPRGEHFTPDTIGERLNLRDFMDTMRSSGVHTGGPPPMGKADRQAFANQLDRLLTRHG